MACFLLFGFAVHHQGHGRVQSGYLVQGGEGAGRWACRLQRRHLGANARGHLGANARGHHGEELGGAVLARHVVHRVLHGGGGPP